MVTETQGAVVDVEDELRVAGEGPLDEFVSDSQGAWGRFVGRAGEGLIHFLFCHLVKGAFGGRVSW